MIQSGTLYTINSTGAATNVPIKNARILFKQGNTIRAQTTTNATTGAYSVDVPLGKYTVELAAGSTTSIVRAGQEFELTSSGNASTFQNWLYSKSGDINDALLKSFKDIADAISRDKTATENAKNEIVNNSIGNNNGKFMKEGASGVGGNAILLAGTGIDLAANAQYKSGIYINNSFDSGFTRSSYGIYAKHQASGYDSWFSWGHSNSSYINLDIRTPSGIASVSLYNTGNTTVDSNGFIKRASPIIKISAKGFEHSGFSEDPICEKIGVGVYKITNTLGLADGIEDGDWYIELPKDRYGDHYFNANLERLDDGVIIRVYERKELYFPSEMSFPDRDGNLVYAQEKIVVNGKQIDLKDEWRFISLRFKEPEVEETEEI